MISTLDVDAPAKVNLLLRVLHRRKDGYRELVTLFQALSLADQVRVTVTATDGDQALSLEVDGPDLGPVESNLAVRAVRQFREVTGVVGATSVRITKHIPAGAGLGGGSSDAAAVLQCLARLSGFEDRAALHSMACTLGSDVPFFLGRSPLAMGEGRGEIITELEPLPEAHLVLALPQVHISTAAAYSALSESRGPAENEGPTPRPSFDFRGLRWSALAELATNDFEEVVSPMHSEVGASLEALREEGASFALLSGSGGASFGLFRDRASAESASEVLTRRFGWPFVPVRTRTVMPSPEDFTEGA